MYEHARQILDLVDCIQREAGQEPSAVSGTIKIACSTVPSEWLLPELLVRFRELYPEVQESVSVSDSAAVERGVGVSFLSTRAIEREILDQRLHAIEIEGVRAVRDLYLITDPQRLPTRVVRAFLDFLESISLAQTD